MKINILTKFLIISILSATSFFAKPIFASPSPREKELIKYSFQLFKPAGKTFNEGFLNIPGVISYTIEDNICIVYAKSYVTATNISNCVLKAGYKMSSVWEDYLSEYEYQNLTREQKKSLQLEHKSNKKWQQGGEFTGFLPEQEIISKRTRNTKHFRITDNQYVAQIGNAYHYKDENGLWKDVDLSIKQDPCSNYPQFKYANLTNEIKTYLPAEPGETGVMLTYGSMQLNWWKNVSMELADYNSFIMPNLKTDSSDPIVSEEKITYSTFPNIDDEFIIKENGIEGNIILTNKNSIQDLTGKSLRFVQFIPLQADYKIYNNAGKIQNSDFTDETFNIKKLNQEKGFCFSPIVTYDASLTKDEAIRILFNPENKLLSESLLKLSKSAIKGFYSIHFVKGGIEVTTSVSSNWLKSTDRNFPVVIDPDVFVGAGVSSQNSPFHIFWNYARNQAIYLQSELNFSGSITAIAYEASNVADADVLNNSQIWMDIVSASIYSSDAWTTPTTNVFGSSTINVTSGTGWKAVTLATPFTYSNSNNLQVSFRHQDASYESTYHTYYYSTTADYKYIYMVLLMQPILPLFLVLMTDQT